MGIDTLKISQANRVNRLYKKINGGLKIFKKSNVDRGKKIHSLTNPNIYKYAGLKSVDDEYKINHKNRIDNLISDKEWKCLGIRIQNIANVLKKLKEKNEYDRISE